MRWTRRMIDRAARRLEADGGGVRIEELVLLAGASKNVLIRWAVDGKHGVTLDAVYDEAGDAWFSSAPAVARFLSEVAWVESHRAELAQAEAADMQRRGVQPADVRAGVPDVRRASVGPSAGLVRAG